MKTLYLDCSMGAAGDMLTAALLDLFSEEEKIEIIKELNSTGLSGVEYKLEKSSKCGITGSHMKVLCNETEEDENMHEHHHEHHHKSSADDHHHHEHTHEHEHLHECHHTHDKNEPSEKTPPHVHSSLERISHIVSNTLKINPSVKKSVMDIYGIIAEAESLVHGRPVTEIHFHEVGTKDAVADITAVCILLEKIGAQKIIASPVHVGSGTVKCAHGILPVPAPATANILKGIPVYGGEINGELCTPTGAALLKYFVNDFSEMPLMKIEQIGYGMGKKDFDRANCVRAILGETSGSKDSVLELSFNLDDMTGEKIGYAFDKLFEAGALDVYSVPVGMKKNRPGILMRVLCREDDKEKIIHEIFKHTTTNGIREQKINRYVMNRKTETVETKWGPVRKKLVDGYGVSRFKFEYEDLARISRENGMSIQDIEDRILG